MPAREKSELEFRDENGQVDQQAYNEYLASLGQLEELPSRLPTPYERKLAGFLSQLATESHFFFELHLTPDNLPYNRIAHWRMAVWQAFKAGMDKGS